MLKLKIISRMAEVELTSIIDLIPLVSFFFLKTLEILAKNTQKLFCSTFIFSTIVTILVL